MKGEKPLQLSDAIRIRINHYMHIKGFSSLWELFKASGVPKSTINALLSNERTSLPRLSTLLHICEGLDTNLRDFFDDPIFLEVEDFAEDNSKN